jgi:hypothetical protein
VTPLSAVILVVTGRYCPGLLTFAAGSPEVADATEKTVLLALSGPYRRDRCSTERRLSGVAPVYAAPDQDVCGVYMSSRSVRHETTDL